MPDPMPTVSVIIPCFNLGAYLTEAVDSVLAQSVQDFEILVADDGSTDPDTIARLDAFARPKTTVIRAPHQGLAATRNLLVQRARGTFVCALDADDRLHPEFLARTLEAFERDPGLTFVSCWLENFGDDTSTWQPTRCDFPTLLAECTVCTAALVRRDPVLAVGGFDGQMPHPGYEDWDLWITLTEQGYVGTIVPEVLFYYRRRAASMSAACCQPPQHDALMRYMVQKHQASYRQHLQAVLVHKEREAAALIRANLHEERALVHYHEPLLDSRRRELARLESKLAAISAQTPTTPPGDAAQAELIALKGQVAALDHELARAYAEVKALRQSWSWKISAPLRVAANWLGLRGSGRGR